MEPIFSHLSMNRDPCSVTSPSFNAARAHNFLILFIYKCFLNIAAAWHRRCQYYLEKQTAAGLVNASTSARLCA